MIKSKNNIFEIRGGWNRWIDILIHFEECIGTKSCDQVENFDTQISSRAKNTIILIHFRSVRLGPFDPMCSKLFSYLKWIKMTFFENFCIGSKIELTFSTSHMTLFLYKIKWIRMPNPLGISKFLKIFGIFGVHNNFGCHQNLIQEKCILKLI